MSLSQILDEDRRGLILNALDEAGGSRLSDSSIKAVLDMFGHRRATDQVRADLHWLEGQALVRLDTVQTGGGATLMVQLLDLGQDVARGVRHPGVRHQAPKQ